MDFRVYVIIEMPILDKSYELLVPIDRRIHEIISIMKKNIPELSTNYYLNHIPLLYNKTSGERYNLNTIIKDSNIKTGTRLLMI